jgi:hypothetical protein
MTKSALYPCPICQKKSKKHIEIKSEGCNLDGTLVYYYCNSCKRYYRVSRQYSIFEMGIRTTIMPRITVELIINHDYYIEYKPMTKNG